MHRIEQERPTPRNSYELIGSRIRSLITSSCVQTVQAIVVSRRDNESKEAWQRVIQDIEETTDAQVDRLSDGAVRIGWRKNHDS